jgi:hypothetical protein
MACPEGWTILNEECWHLPVRDAGTLWGAVCRADYTRPVLLRQQVLLVGQRGLHALLSRLSTPAVIMAVLEDLVREGCLRRPYATHLEECILAHVQAEGRWHGDSAAPAPQSTRHAPDIITLAETVRPP